MTMAEINANTDKEFVPSAVAVKELGVDFIVERGSNANGNYEKWNSGKLVMWGTISIASLTITNASGNVFFVAYTQNLPVTSLTATNIVVSAFNNVGAWVDLSTTTSFLSNFGMYFYRGVSGTVSTSFNYQAIGTWK